MKVAPTPWSCWVIMYCEPLDDRDHGDHRGDADDDAERGQDRAHLVGAERLEGDAEVFEEDHGGVLSVPTGERASGRRLDGPRR